MYPYHIFITGNGSFNNFFLFSYYLENYVTDNSILYTAKPSVFDPMADVFASRHNLTHMACKAQELLRKLEDKQLLYDKIASSTDLLLIYGDKQKFSGMITAFNRRKKKHEFIDVFPTDIVSSDIPEKGKEVVFSDVYGDFLQQLSPDKKLLCYKFLASLPGNKDLLDLVIKNKNAIYQTKNQTEQEIAQNLYWIYKNQYASLVDFRKKFDKQPVFEDPHLCTSPYQWKYEGERIPIYTGTGLKLARAYTSIITGDGISYVEIADRDIIKSHVYRALGTQVDDEDDVVKIDYHTSDHESYPLFYQTTHFDGSIIKMGYWYINSKYVTPINPKESH